METKTKITQLLTERKALQFQEYFCAYISDDRVKEVALLNPHEQGLLLKFLNDYTPDTLLQGIYDMAYTHLQIIYSLNESLTNDTLILTCLKYHNQLLPLRTVVCESRLRQFSYMELIEITKSLGHIYKTKVTELN